MKLAGKVQEFSFFLLMSWAARINIQWISLWLSFVSEAAAFVCFKFYFQMSVFSEETDVAVDRNINDIISFTTEHFSLERPNYIFVWAIFLCVDYRWHNLNKCVAQYICPFFFRLYLWSFDYNLIIWIFLFFFYFSDYWLTAVSGAVVHTMITSENKFTKSQKRPVTLNINTFRQLAFTYKHALLLNFLVFSSF